MNSIDTYYGWLHSIANYDTYETGEIRDVFFSEENIIETSVGNLIPTHSSTDNSFDRQKKRRSSLTFFPNGMIKSLATETQTMINTPLGAYEAELITFYDDGKLHRFFPLNGALSGFWSEDEEGALAKTYSFEFDFGAFETKIIGLSFYPSGALKSLTLWPGEVVTLDTPFGKMDVRIGFSLYENGNLKTVEPGTPVAIETPIGSMTTFNPDALGVHGDTNSLVFNEDGGLKSMMTVKNGVLIQDPLGVTHRIEPDEVPSYVDEDDTVIVPLKITFETDSITFDNGAPRNYPHEDHAFYPYDPEAIALRASSGCGSSGGCSSCSGCSH